MAIEVLGNMPGKKNIKIIKDVLKRMADIMLGNILEKNVKE